jgi:hypothetical protein
MIGFKTNLCIYKEIYSNRMAGYKFFTDLDKLRRISYSYIGDGMKKSIIRIISLTIVLCTVATLASCKKSNDNDAEITAKVSTKASTSQAVKIVDLPTEKADILKMFNAALDYVDVYCYSYSKAVKCSVSDLNIGSLSSASNASDAFKSIFGTADTSADYNYKTSENDFNNNFIKSGFTAQETANATVKQDGDNIVITVEFPSETNPASDKGILSRMGNVYYNVDNINSNLKDFESTASSVNIAASDLKMVATISAEDSSLNTLEVYYKEKYTLSGVTLVKLEGGTVTGTADTKITYNNFGQN